MGILDSAIDDFLDSGLEFGLKLAGASSKKNSIGKSQTVSQAFTSRRLVYGEHLVPGTPVLVQQSGYRGEPNYLSLVYVLASQQSDFVSEVRYDDVPMMIGVENAYDYYNSFTWRDGASSGEKIALGQSRIDSRIELAYQRAHLGKDGHYLNGGVYQHISSGSYVINGTDEFGYIPIGFTYGRHRFEGITAVYLRLKYSSSLYPSGLPSISFKMRGKVVYDPRTQLKSYSDNYALCVLDFFKTILKIPDASINTQSFIDAANICDEDTPTTPGNTEKRFTVSGILELDKTPLENLEALLSAGGGWLSYVQGQWHLFLPVYSAPILALTDSDLVKNIRFQPKSNKQTRMNTVRGSYISAESDYDRIEAPTLKVQAYIDNDGEQLEDSFDYVLVSSGYQVQRLNKIKLEQSRYGIVLSGVFKFKALAATVGDRVTLSITSLGWENKIFQIIKYEIDYSAGVKLTLREDDPSIYDWTSGDAIPIESPPVLNLPDHSTILPPDSISLSEELYQTNNSREIKARVIIEWVPSDGTDYKYDLELKETSETEWTQVVWRYQGSRAVFNDIAPATYDIRVRSVNDVGFVSDWLEISATVLGKTAPPPDIGTLFLDNGVLVWNYPNEPLDLAGFKIRFHNGDRQTWADATPLHDGLWSATRFNGIGSITGIKTFLVKAIDTTGNESINAGIVVTGLGDTKIGNIFLTYDYAANTWPGTITDGSINVSNEIEAHQVGGFYNADGGSIFYDQDGSSSFYQGQFLKLVYEFSYTVLGADEGSQLTIDAIVSNTPSFQIDYKNPGSTVWVPFPGFVTYAEVGVYNFRLSIPAKFGVGAPALSGLVLSLDVDDIVEDIENVAVSNTGVRLPITKTYRKITHVSLTLQTDGSGADSVKITDKSESLGPLIHTYNAQNVEVASIIDAQIRGY